MFPKQWQQEEHHISWTIAKIILQFPASEQISNKIPRLKREVALPDARARNTAEKQSFGGPGNKMLIRIRIWVW